MKRKFQEKVAEKIKHTIYVQYIFFFENSAVCEKMWKNIVQMGRTQMTILRMRITCCVPQATDKTLRI
jgi:hypothetical protein